MKKFLVCILLIISVSTVEAQVSMYAEPVFGRVWSDVNVKPYLSINLPNDIDVKKNQTFWELGLLYNLDWLSGRVYWLLGNNNTGFGNLGPSVYDIKAKDSLPVSIENRLSSWRFELGIARNVRGMLVEPFFVNQFTSDFFKITQMSGDLKNDIYSKEINLTSSYPGMGLTLTLPVYMNNFVQVKGFATNKDYMMELRYAVGMNALKGTFGWTYRVFDIGVDNNIRHTITGPFLSVGVSF